MTPMEIESQEIGCRLAIGRTIVMGLGMGWAAAATAMSPAVTQVTVVESDPEVIGMNAEQNIFAQLPRADAAKLAIVAADALHYRPDFPADTLLADIWRPLNGDERVAEVRQMAANVGARRVYFWGQEMTIARRARQLGKKLDARTVDQIVASLDLPLIGPELDNYPELIERAAAHWLRDYAERSSV